MLRRKSNAAALRARVRGARLVGTFVKLGAIESLEAAAAAGFDFAIVDLEHSQLSEGGALRLVNHASALGFPAIVRVASSDAGLLNRLLEAGASGIQLSNVRSAEQVRDLVAATRFAPEGRRSVSLAHPMAGFGKASLRETVGADPPLLVGQIENERSDDDLKEIFAAGLDVAFAGVTDLRVDVEFDESRVAARLAEIRDAAAATGVVFGVFAADAESVPEDARYVALSSDVSLLVAAMEQAVRRAR